MAYPDHMRVPRTFVFCDLTGFTNFTAEHGDDAAGNLLANFRSVTRAVASERGVRIAKWLGDGAMIVCLDPDDALAAALELEARTAVVCKPLALRAGIAGGYALLFEGDDYIGSMVNLAARLCDAAGPHEILLPADQAVDAPAWVDATEVGTLALRGFAEPIGVVAITGTAPPAQRNDTGELWTRSPIVN